MWLIKYGKCHQHTRNRGRPHAKQGSKHQCDHSERLFWPRVRLGRDCASVVAVQHTDSLHNLHFTATGGCRELNHPGELNGPIIFSTRSPQKQAGPHGLVLFVKCCGFDAAHSEPRPLARAGSARKTTNHRRSAFNLIPIDCNLDEWSPGPSPAPFNHIKHAVAPPWGRSWKLKIDLSLTFPKTCPPRLNLPRFYSY
jgi:hypothetical protein